MVILLSITSGCVVVNNSPQVTPAQTPAQVRPALTPVPTPSVGVTTQSQIITPSSTTSRCPRGYYWGGDQCRPGFVSASLLSNSVHRGDSITVIGTCEGYPAVTIDVYQMSGASLIPITSQEVAVRSDSTYEAFFPTGGFSLGQYAITVTAAPDVYTKLSVMVTG